MKEKNNMFEVGQKVVCVNDTPQREMPVEFIKPKKGLTYTVREIYEHPNGTIAITVDEIINQFSTKLGRELGFNIDRFRPLEWDSWAESVLNEISEEVEDEFFARILR